MSSELKINDCTSCLIVLCLDQIALAVTPQCPEGSFIYDNVTYADEGFGDFTGFYDWLRNGNGEVIGVRYLPAEELEFLCDALTQLPYVKVNREVKSVELYFSADRTIDESSSNDQDFGDNTIFKSPTGTYAVSFNASGIIDRLEQFVNQHSLELKR